MLVRDIIDIDSTYEDFEASDDEEVKTKKNIEKKLNQKMRKTIMTKTLRKKQRLMKRMNLIYPLQKWKKKLNRKYLNY